MADQAKSFYCIEDYNSVVHFERLRKRLLEENDAERLQKPLAYWALASDRRLPFAFLGRTLNELLNTPFEELLATPGVGHKKIASLITLLVRATTDSVAADFPRESAADSAEPGAQGPGESDSADSQFDPLMVSEVMWSRWRGTVRRHGFGSVKLGRLAPTLQLLPTVIWHKPLDQYTDLSLIEIRQLKTHGEKRIRGILEIFWGVHEALASTMVHRHLHLQLVPRFVYHVQNWIVAATARPEAVTARNVCDGLAKPLLAQVETDAGSTIRKIAAERLGVNRSPLSVRQQSQRMGVTRARVYQQLEECGKIMDVRWPEGEHLFGAFGQVLDSAGAEQEAGLFFERLAGLFYPRGLGEDVDAFTRKRREVRTTAAS